jgi:hypothetical protein
MTILNIIHQAEKDNTMINRSAVLTVTISAVLTMAAPTFADRGNGVQFAQELDTCIAAVTRNLDLADANRVRHIVIEKNHSGSAYALTIETSVFSGSGVKTYEAYCVARGDKEPLRFRIDEVRS